MLSRLSLFPGARSDAASTRRREARFYILLALFAGAFANGHGDQVLLLVAAASLAAVCSAQAVRKVVELRREAQPAPDPSGAPAGRPRVRPRLARGARAAAARSFAGSTSGD